MDLVVKKSSYDNDLIKSAVVIIDMSDIDEAKGKERLNELNKASINNMQETALNSAKKIRQTDI